MEIGITILGYLLPVIASILTMFLIAGAKKLMDKLGLERAEKMDTIIEKYVAIGVNAAEVAGRKYLDGKMPEVDKRSKAISTVMAELDKAGITGVAEELVVDRIEHWLEIDGKEPGIPSDPTDV